MIINLVILRFAPTSLILRSEGKVTFRRIETMDNTAVLSCFMVVRLGEAKNEYIITSVLKYNAYDKIN